MSFDPLRTVCARLPGATKDIKWGADEVYSVGGKMFAVFWIDAGHARTVSFKCDPERFLELTDVPGIVPAPYLARAHWVQVREASALPRVQAEALLADSHARVLAGLTRKLQAEIAGTPPKAAATQPKTRSGASAPKPPTRKKPR